MDGKNQQKSLKERIRSGKLKREDVARRLAELAFGKVNDCVKLVLNEDVAVEKCSYLSDAEAFCTPVTAFYAGEEKDGVWIPYREPEPEPETE